MKIDILTLFPNMFSGPFSESIIKRAQDRNLVQINIHNLRKWAKDRHNTVDDHPYGGGVGMVLMVEPIYDALQELRHKGTQTILMDAGGETHTQSKAKQLTRFDHLIIIAGHYEGVDHRIREYLIDEEISIGNYVLTGGEIPAMVIIDSIVRLIPGVITKEDATSLESFSLSATDDSLLIEYPQYTRPEEFRGWKVPKVLTSGDHKKIERWKVEEAIKRTEKHKNH